MQDIEEYFSDPSDVREGVDVEFRKTKGKVKRKPIKRREATRRNIDYSPQQFEDLEEISTELGVTSQAVVKMALQSFIDDFFEKKRRKLDLRERQQKA